MRAGVEQARLEPWLLAEVTTVIPAQPNESRTSPLMTDSREPTRSGSSGGVITGIRRLMLTSAGRWSLLGFEGLLIQSRAQQRCSTVAKRTLAGLVVHSKTRRGTSWTNVAI